MFRLLLAFSLFSFASLFGKQTICLNMIVKNESAVIKRCLDSVKPLIDYWVIVDTGSIDGTQEIIKEHLKGIPGELYERPWKNFGYNRTEAIALAKGKADYLLIIDADDALQYPADFRFNTLDKECYEMWRGTSDFSFLFPQLIKADLPWKWVGVVHEYLSCDLPFRSEPLENIKYCSIGGGARSCGNKKFYQYIQLLEEALKSEPNNCRYVFYLGESYRDIDQLEKSIESYQKRVKMGGWDEEVFWSLYQIALLKERLKAPSEEIIQCYLRAHHFRSHRVEPLYHLAAYYNRIRRFDLAYECLKGMQYVPQPATSDVLFNEAWMKRWGLLMELSICSYYLGHYTESLFCNDQLLLQELSESVRSQVESNRLFALEKVKENAIDLRVVSGKASPVASE